MTKLCVAYVPIAEQVKYQDKSFIVDFTNAVPDSDSGIEKFREINELKYSLSTETTQFEEILKGLMHAIGNSVQAVARMKVASVDKVVIESNRLLYQILMLPTTITLPYWKLTRSIAYVMRSTA